MATEWKQEFSNSIDLTRQQAVQNVGALPRLAARDLAFFNRLIPTRPKRTPCPADETATNKSIRQFAETLRKAVEADACIVFEQFDGGTSETECSFKLLSACSTFQEFAQTEPDLNLPGIESNLEPISLGDTCAVHYYTRALEPNSPGLLGRYARMLHLSFAVEPGKVWIAQLYRTAAPDPFKRDIEAKLKSILPLIVNHAVLLVQGQQKIALEVFSQQLADQMCFGLFFLNEHCQLLWSNLAGKDILGTGDPLKEQNGHVSIRRRHENALMHAHVAKVCEEPSLSFGNYMVMEAVHSGSLHPSLIHILPGGGISGHACALVMVFNPELSLERALMPVCHTLGLSPSESRLAIALSDGASLKEAARDLGIKEYTARTYLKQIFGKLRVQRQADLVRILLKSALPFRVNTTIT